MGERSRELGTTVRAAACLCAAVLVLSACDGLGRSLGLGKQTPDEFQVVQSPKLTVPPDFSLRPPTPGAPPRTARPVRDKAEEDLFGAEEPWPAMGASGETPGEGAFIEEADARNVDPGIRRAVDRDHSIYVEEDESFVESLLIWREDQPPGEVIDAKAEARRLQENEAAGAPVTAGETPTIKRRERALLEGIF